MHFESRELKPHAEPVRPADLTENDVYFTVQFADESLLIPIVEPLVFVGRNLREGDSDLLYFQNFDSYAAGIRYQSASAEDKADFHARGPEDLRHIYEYERALDVLCKCSLRRRRV